MKDKHETHEQKTQQQRNRIENWKVTAETAHQGNTNLEERVKRLEEKNACLVHKMQAMEEEHSLQISPAVTEIEMTGHECIWLPLMFFIYCLLTL